MQYRKFIRTMLIAAVFVAVVNQFVFATSNVLSGDTVLDKALDVFVMIQRYSWPVAILAMIYALYKYYVRGSEVLADKILGQKMVLGISVFMVVIQVLPLIYAFAIL